MLKLVLGGGLFLYLAAAAALYFGQRKLLYFPTPAVAHGLTVEWLQSGEHSLEVIVLNPDQPRAVLYFGGNAEPVSAAAPLLQQALAGHSVYLLNYRGYGASSGSPSEQALFADALALYDKVNDRHQQLSVIGRSLGTGIAVYLATERAVENLVLVTPYDSISAVAQAHYPFFPVRYLIKDRFDSLSRAAELTVPTLVILAETDTVIPRAHSDKLVAALPDAQQWIAAGSGHNSVDAHPEYAERLSQFLQSS